MICESPDVWLRGLEGIRGRVGRVKVSLTRHSSRPPWIWGPAGVSEGGAANPRSQQLGARAKTKSQELLRPPPGVFLAHLVEIISSR